MNQINNFISASELVFASIMEDEKSTLLNNKLDNFNQYVVAKGDNLYNISKEYQIDLDTLKAINGLEADDYIYPGQKLLVPKSNMVAYIVGENETLQDVSKKMKNLTSEIINDNPKIYLLPGQLLIVKKGEIS